MQVKQCQTYGMRVRVRVCVLCFYFALFVLPFCCCCILFSLLVFFAVFAFVCFVFVMRHGELKKQKPTDVGQDTNVVLFCFDFFCALYLVVVAFCLFCWSFLLLLFCCGILFSLMFGLSFFLSPSEHHHHVQHNLLQEHYPQPLSPTPPTIASSTTSTITTSSHHRAYEIEF